MSDLLKQLYDPEAFRQLGHRLIDLLADHHRGNLEERHLQAIPWNEPEKSLKFWESVTQRTITPEALFKSILEQSTAVHHPKYIGHQVGMSAPISVLFALLSSYLNNGMAVYEMGMVSAPLEKWITDQLCQRFGFPEQSGGLLTSGGTLANLTAMLSVRRTKAGSIAAGKQPAIMVSEEAHYCIDRAVLTMGWPKEAAIKIPTDEQFVMRTELLEYHLQKAESQGMQVIAVVGSACSTSTGSYDPLDKIASFCQQHQLWFHVDGAHGSCVVFSDRFKFLIKGIERADSIVLDFHKMLMAPALCTALLYKNQDHSFQTFQQEAAYLLDGERDWYNTGKRTYECTKYMMSVIIFSLWQQYGDGIYSAYVNTLYERARAFAELIAAQKDFELAAPVQSNILCFRWWDGHLAGDQLNQKNREIRRRLVEGGEFYIVQTTLRGKAYFRLTVMNPFTELKHLKNLLNKIRTLCTVVPG